ncbi:hypothetical protein [Sphingomonas panacis]|uniref:hypothetical protein n=1 Tax=Sphingomonas panacis TaxID=1560345 RepID=UPI001F0A9011|nr:hypothetical protein [Sphingomonas panacis]
MWLIMRGALAARPEVLSRDYYLPSMTGISTLLLENRSRTGMLRPVSELDRATLELPQRQSFTLGLSVERYDLNRFLQQMVVPEHRTAFLADEAGALAGSGLDPIDQALISSCDRSGLIERGAIFFGLEKLAAVLGLPNAVVYVGMHGETLEKFRASRNAPEPLDSVGSTLGEK